MNHAIRRDFLRDLSPVIHREVQAPVGWEAGAVPIAKRETGFQCVALFVAFDGIPGDGGYGAP